MKKLSCWAKANLWSARIIVVLLHFLLVAAAIYTGTGFRRIGISINPVWNGLAIVLFIFAALCYPKKSSNIPAWISRYFYQKTCDFTLTFVGLFMICFLWNHPSGEMSKSNLLLGAYPTSQRPQSSQIEKPNHAGKSLHSFGFSRKDRKGLLKELRSELKTFFKAKSNSTGRTALLILTVIAAVALALLVAALSCNLSCSGNEGAAVFLLIFGLAAVILLTILVIRKINRTPRRRHDYYEDRGTTFKGV